MSIFKKLKGSEKHNSKPNDPINRQHTSKPNDPINRPVFENNKKPTIDPKGTYTTGSNTTQKPTYSVQYSWSYPRIVNKKLTIFLLENTKKSIDAKNTILKIIHKFSSSDLVCFITYGSTVKVGQVKKMSNFNTEKLLNIDDLNDNACFYDALQILHQVITIALNRVQDEKFGNDKYKIESIDVIGIGSGLDVGSKSSKDDAMESFSEIIEKRIETKYFCFSEDNFTEVASIGFRSIGAFPTKHV